MKLNLSEIPYKFRHFYWNKYVLKLFKKERFFMSYSYRYKAIWFRNYKVASRTINNYLTADSKSWIIDLWIGHAVFKTRCSRLLQVSLKTMEN